MPPLHGALPRNFSRNAAGLLTQVGHERLLVIVDTSFDPPDGCHSFYYLGNNDGDTSAARVLKDIAVACPIEVSIPVRFMLADANDPERRVAPERNREGIEALGLTALGLERHGPDGFYAYALGSNPAKLPIYCLTASGAAYDNLAASIGASSL